MRRNVQRCIYEPPTQSLKSSLRISSVYIPFVALHTYNIVRTSLILLPHKMAFQIFCENFFSSPILFPQYFSTSLYQVEILTMKAFIFKSLIAISLVLVMLFNIFQKGFPVNSCVSLLFQSVLCKLILRRLLSLSRPVCCNVRRKVER